VNGVLRVKVEKSIIVQTSPFGKTRPGMRVFRPLPPRSVPTAKKPSKSKKPSAGSENERLITENRKARHDYAVLETLECGIMLRGSEVKSLRQGKVSLAEAFGRVKEDEVWLLGCDIAEYVEANQFNHEPRRPRKLLMHRREVERFASRAFQQGLTLIPLKMYFKRGRAKVLMGICKGQQRHDKREAMKKSEARREMARHMQRRSRQ